MAVKNPDKELRFFLIIVIVFLSALIIGSILVANSYLIFSYFWFLIRNYWWLIFPIPLWYMFLQIWFEYLDLKWVLGQKYDLLEIIVPSETEKSPKIMEQVLYACHQHSSLNRFEYYCGWRPMQPKFSFEIVSLSGVVHFIIHCPRDNRDSVEAAIYSHYPDAEILTAKDYTEEVPKVLPNRDWDVWGSIVKLTGKDVLPIRTYPYFKEDVTGKMIDPLSSLIEVMGTISKNQNMWLQIVTTAMDGSEWKPEMQAYVDEITKQKKPKENKGFFGFLGSFFAELSILPKNLFRGYFGQELEGVAAGGIELPDKFNINELPPSKQEELKAILENSSRMAFRTTMRYLYIGKREGFNKAVAVGGFFGAMKQFADENFNGFRPDTRTKTFANYYFTDPRLDYRKRKLVQNFQGRSFAGTGFTFHADELATIYHFPDMSVKAANISRIEAQKSDAPANLPVDLEDEIDFEAS